MSSTPPPHSPSLSVEPDEAQSSPPPVQPESKTPGRECGAPRSIPDTTPLSHGSSMCQSHEGDTDWVEEFDWEDYGNCIREDLRSRVFVDFEVFMKHVLHVPDNWRTSWGPAIEAVKADSDFKRHHEEYCNHCDKIGSQEKTFYGPLMNAANAVLEAVSRSAFDGISSRVPNLVVLPKDRQPSEGLRSENPLRILKFNPYNNSLCDGTRIPRLIVDEVDPILNHALAHKPLRRAAKKSIPIATSTTASGSTSGSSKSRKRPADESSTADEPARKKLRTKSTSGRVPGASASAEVREEDEDSPTPEPETLRQVRSATQVCCQLAEMFSASLLRSHATVSLVDRDRLQLYHANRSVIFVSSAANFSEGDGLSKFIAIAIAFNCLPLKQNGILDTLAEKNTKLVKNSEIPVDNKVVQRGNQLDFRGDELQERFTVNLGNVISHYLATVGRSTVVLEATSDQWPGIELVVKISWPGSGQDRETDFLKRANEEAEETDGKWATNHLPRVFYATDVVFDGNSALESVVGLFKDAKFANGKFLYERRILRVIVQERLHPFKSLTNVRDIGQVILDVTCIHRWLFDCPGILHRDLSPNNIMYRVIKEMDPEGKSEQKVYGVLTDYDLSSWKRDLNNDHTMTSQQWTGTPPYMAQELLQGTSTTHLYRHDVESLFYIMLLIAARYTIVPTKGGRGPQAKIQVVMREGTLPYQKWFSAQDYEALGRSKEIFILHMPGIELPPAFEDFHPWLEEIRSDFLEGFTDRPHFKRQKLGRRKRAGGSASRVTPASVLFDDETLGGNVDYSTIIEPTRDLKGELEGLIIRYKPTLPPLPAPAGGVRADA